MRLAIFLCGWAIRTEMRGMDAGKEAEERVSPGGTYWGVRGQLGEKNRREGPTGRVSGIVFRDAFI